MVDECLSVILRFFLSFGFTCRHNNHPSHSFKSKFSDVLLEKNEPFVCTGLHMGLVCLIPHNKPLDKEADP